MIRIVFVLLCCTFFLAGCWNNQELDDSALVHGIGLDRADNKNIRMIVEIIKPTSGNQGSNSRGGGDGMGQHIVLEREARTLIEGARGFIRDTKRRLHFGHLRTWVVSQELAEEGFVPYLDSVRRDQMLRLSSYLFITQDDPKDVLNTPTLYENLTATELVSAIDQTQFIAEYAPINLREFYRFLEGPVPNAYAPIIFIKDEGDEVITSIDGTAVIRGVKMVGQLDATETRGLNFLLNRVQGGSATVDLNETEQVSLEISKAKTKTKTYLKDGRLTAHTETRVEGTLADNMTERNISEAFFREVEKKFAQSIEEDMRKTLRKLQKELKTDITNIGHVTHRKYPKEFREVSAHWNEVFAEAIVTLDVKVKITHNGLVREDIHRSQPKPFNNPYTWTK